jgi:glycosyltransferase involved in cell wall biosynthesis
MISENVGLFQYVQTQDYGWVTTLNPAEVAVTIEAAIQDKQKRQRITATAPSAIRAEYDDKHLAQQYLDLYADSLHKQV